MRELVKTINQFEFPFIAVVLLILMTGSVILSQIGVCIEGGVECLNIASFGNWDGQHFLNIAQKGYINSYELAFFPLYPVLIKILDTFLPASALIVGIGLNWVLTVTGFLYLYKLLQLDFKRPAVWWILGLIISFPLSFFFLVLYSESLFFCLSVAALYYFRQQKKWTVILLLTLLTLTRMAGIALVLAILIDVYKKKSWWHFLFPLFGIGSFVIFGFFNTGNLLAIVQAETNWERLVTVPGFVLFNSIFVLVREGVSYRNYSVAIDLVLVGIVLAILLRSYRLLSRLYWNYALFSILIPLSTSTFLSFPRFLIVIFPLFIAIYLLSNTIVRLGYVIVGILLLVFFFINFLKGIWVA